MDIHSICEHICTDGSERKSNERNIYIYSELVRTYHECIPKIMQKIIMGEFNVKIDKEKVYKSEIGLDSLYQISNDNGTQHITFVISKNILICSTFFPHKGIYNIHTYVDNTKWNGPTKNQNTV